MSRADTERGFSWTLGAALAVGLGLTGLAVAPFVVGGTLLAAVLIVALAWRILHSVLFWIAVLPVLLGGFGWMVWRVTAPKGPRVR